MSLALRLLATVAAILALAIAPRCSRAADRDWSDGQLVLAGAAIVLHSLDWAQTRHIARTNEPGYVGSQFVEKAPGTRAFIGETPSTRGVDTYMLATGAAFLLAANYFPEERNAILGFWAATRLAVVIRNDQLGLRVSKAF